ncbi:MAG: DJ-1/PfpI family protein [Polyangiales bacterium]
MEQAVHVVVFDGLPDWEPALALAALRDASIPVRTVGFTSEPVITAAGMRVVPDLALEEIDPTRVKLLIVPGGDHWEASGYPVSAFESLLAQLRTANVPVAAICGATVALARAGSFEGKAHTGNGRQWLKSIVPSYAGEDLYQEELAVRQDGLITAPGSAPVEFAREVIRELDAMPQDRLEHWFTLFKTGRLPEGVDAAQIFTE